MRFPRLLCFPRKMARAICDSSLPCTRALARSLPLFFPLSFALSCFLTFSPFLTLSLFHSLSISRWLFSTLSCCLSRVRARAHAHSLYSSLFSVCLFPHIVALALAQIQSSSLSFFCWFFPYILHIRTQTHVMNTQGFILSCARFVDIDCIGNQSLLFHARASRICTRVYVYVYVCIYIHVYICIHMHV